MLKCPVVAALLYVIVIKGTSAVPLDPRFNLSQEEFSAMVAPYGQKTVNAVTANPKRFFDLIDAMSVEKEPGLFLLIDKTHPLADKSDPPDLVSLDVVQGLYPTRKGLRLRAIVVSALQEMSLAAIIDGVVLLESSAYRSYDYQKKVYAGWVKKLGKPQADRLSAPPGASQHMLGTAVDFDPIDASFTGTRADLWLRAHAQTYGFSLSFPMGHEKETGYSHESWHFRYLGVDACALQREFFDDLQYKLLAFWHDNAINFRKARVS